jgi:putative tricarboxylic transport membrane protein
VLRALQLGLALAVVVTGSQAHGAAAGWKAERNVEIVVNTAPGSGQDTMARTIQRILTDRRIVEAPMVVANRAGGGGAIAYNYLKELRVFLTELELAKAR